MHLNLSTIIEVHVLPCVLKRVPPADIRIASAWLKIVKHQPIIKYGSL